MENKVQFLFNEKEINIIYSGLLELPGKISLPVIDSLKDQISKLNESLTKQDNVEPSKEK